VSPFGEFIPLRREGLRGRIFQKKKYNKLNMTSPCTLREGDNLIINRPPF
jgi:hypothetical protein